MARLGCVLPTAQALLTDVAATPRTPPRLALGTCFQAVPFQCRIITAPLTVPTAQASLSDTAATLSRMAPGPGLGAGTGFHAVPSQCRISVLLKLSWPTAQAFPSEVAATAARSMRPA